MLRRNDPANGDPTDGTRDDEARIRADERANVEREMRTFEDERRAPEGAATTGDDRATDASMAAGDRHDRDRDGVDDRIERDDRTMRDRDGVDDRRDRAMAGGAAAAGDDRTTRDRDRDGVDDRIERDDRGDRDRDGVDDRIARDDRRDERDERAGMVVQEDEPIEVERTRAFSFGQLLTMLAGAALVVLGVVALIDTGVDTPLSDQTGEVLGWSHSALLGIFEIVAGALLIIFSLRPGGRWLVAVVGLALIVAGVMILGELDWAVDNLDSEQSFAWVPIVAGLVALLASVLTPRRTQRMTGVPVVR